MRVGLIVAALLLTIAAPARADEDRVHRCGNVRADLILMPAKDGDFGAFRIRAWGVGCRTARRVASTYVISPGDPSKRTHIGRWRCTARTLDAQVVRVRCVMGEARISFRNQFPSG